MSSSAGASGSKQNLLLSDDLERARATVSSQESSVSQRFALSPSPISWGTPLDMDSKEPDDHLHMPDPIRDRRIDKGGSIFTARGIANLGCLFILAAGCLMLFAGFPILQHFLAPPKQTTQGGFNLGGTNATGQVAAFPTNFELIDLDTPQDAYTKKSYETGEDMVLVFSDEFNQDGRTFFPGDDPFWEGVDLHYWGTNDLEWYDVTQPFTQGGALRLSLTKVNPEFNHNLSYRSAMIQSWNKFCFTGGLLEVSVTLPGSNEVGGLWPAVWAMGNLGRAGFGGSLDGMWPYSYDTCDVGTLPNQTYPGTQTPAAALSGGDGSKGGVLSYLPGQRLSACTCPGESHPGPMRGDGTYVGRAAPEIDVFEALVEGDGGKVSLSAQWAPYNAGYKWDNSSANIQIYDATQTHLNTYVGGVYQQTTSGLSFTNQDCYEMGKACFAVYGFEYKPGYDDAYITWINDNKKSWSIRGNGMRADTATEIGARLTSVEPMYIIANLGFSENFAQIDYDKLHFPATISIDYVRVYQPKDSINIGCDPANAPTRAYIEAYNYVYTNPNITTWDHANQTWPRNRLLQPGAKC